MKWLWIVLATPVVLGVLLALVGALLPAGHAAARRLVVPAPAARVFATITDVESFPRWRPGLRSVEWLPDRGGRRCFREIGPHGPMDLAIERAEPDRAFVTRIVTERSPFDGTWTFRIDERDGTTTVTLTEHGEVHNVVFRALARFVFGHGATIEAYLRALATRLDATDAPITSAAPDAAPSR